MKVYYVLLIFFCSLSIFAQNTAVWKKISKASPEATKLAISDKEEFFILNNALFEKNLPQTKNNGTFEIKIPNLEGELATFLVHETSNFDTELQALYPQIRSFSGIGLSDKSATIFLSSAPSGIQTMVTYAAKPTEFIERQKSDTILYKLFSDASKQASYDAFACTTPNSNQKKIKKNSTAKIATDKKFRSLRLALSCTGEYAAYFGGTVEGALAGMNATLTRVNGIFNRDLALRLILINNTTIIYTNANTDPYSDGITGAQGSWSQQLQTTLKNIVGDTNYDMGHLFGASGGGGNAGCIGCVCDNQTELEGEGKGTAFTSPLDGQPEGDTFDIDFVAHEMGHQLGAYHTFSHLLEGSNSSIEPGSGSTIMGYAGLTTDFDIQANSDDYFSSLSIEQILDNLATKSCPLLFTTTNNAPVVNAGNDFVIPKGTAFLLKSTASDADGDALTYCWEQRDAATSPAASADNSLAISNKPNGPLFRSFPPTTENFRYFPSYQNVLSNKLTSPWESVATVARKLNFSVTVRDNASLNTAQIASDEVAVTVANVGPFALTTQNMPNTSWFSGSTQTIQWSVNNTNSLQGAALVNIKLSTDGGQTFPITLAQNTPNDGYETIEVPNIVSKNCRLLLEPTNSIFYAINAVPFAIGYTSVATCENFDYQTPYTIPEQENYLEKEIIFPDTNEVLEITKVSIALNFSHSYLADVDAELVSPSGTVVKLFNQSCSEIKGTLNLNFEDTGGLLDCNSSTEQTIAPVGSLRTFNGQNPEGKWILRVRDVFEDDLGTINTAELNICSQEFSLFNGTNLNEKIVLAPNPNSGNFSVNFTSTTGNPIKVMAHNVLGQLIFENSYENTGNINTEIQLPSTIQNGVYFVSILEGTTKTIKKIIVN